VIGLWPFAWETPKQIPVAPFGIRSHNAKIVTGADVLVRDPGWDDYHVASFHFEILAVLATESQSGNT
jgi:hypothetical protein